MKTNLSSFLQWRFNIFIYQKLGWKFSFHYITGLISIFLFFKKKEKQKLKMGIESVFALLKQNSEIKTLIKKASKGILFHYYEKLFNAFSSAETLKTFLKTNVKCQGLMTVNQALSRNKGALLITGHFGGVELIPGYLGLNNYPVTIIAKFSSDHLRKMSIDQGKEFNSKIIDANNTPNIMRAIFNNLKEKRLVITMCDEFEEWRPSLNDSINFLGKQTNLDRTINILMKRGGAPIIFGLMHRDDNRQYELILKSIEEITDYFNNTQDMSPGEMILKYLEQYIYKYPEEWYQWKKTPDINTITAPDEGPKMPVLPLGLKPAFENAI